MLKKVKKMSLYIISALVIYILGAVTVHYKLFPYTQLHKLKQLLKDQDIDQRPIYLRNKVYLRETNLFNIYDTQNVDIVMLGDSLTKRVHWSELMGTPIINRGMDSDITEGYLHRLEDIYKLKPKRVFLNGGTNDINRGYSVQEIFTTYKKIFKLLQDKGITPYMQSVVYTNYPPYNVKIKGLNQLLKEYCLEQGIVFIDINEKLSKDNMLIKEYTLDGSHLNAQGYLVWKEQIQSFI